MKFVWGFLLVLLLVPTAARADEAAARKLAELQDGLSDISAISGNFIQRKQFDFLNEPVLSRGRFHFSRPDYLRWEYLEPAPSGLIIDGGRVRAWSGPPDKKEAQPEAMAEAAKMVAGQVMMWMKLDPKAIEAAYEVEILAERPLKLKVTPRRSGARKYFQGLEVEFSPDARTVRKVTVFETESRTVLTFERVTLNRPRPAE